jgi:hypothetical protein
MANNFKLTLDTLAPKGSITMQADFLRENATLIIDKGDATHMKVWFDTKPSGDKKDVETQDWETAVEFKTTNFSTDGNYYYHLLLKDDVANESVVSNTEMITYDKTLPTVNEFKIMDRTSDSISLTNERVIKYTITCSDNLAGIDAAYLTGDYIEDVTIDADKFTGGIAIGEITIKSDAPQGSISVKAIVVDKAGNESLPVTKSIVLDTDVGTPSIVLTKDGAEAIAANSYINYHKVFANVSLADTDIVGYKIWETIKPDTYTEFTNADHNKPFSVSEAVELSAGDGVKTVYAQLLDASGTDTTIVEYTINIDTVKPVVTLSAPLNSDDGKKSIISAVDGYNTIELTMQGTDASAGVKSYVLKAGEAVLISGSAKDAPTSYMVKNTDLVDGNNTITLEVVDNAENVNSASVIIELDITAPDFDVPALDTWYNAKFGRQFSYDEKNAIIEVYAWTNTKTTDTVVPENTVNVSATAGNVDLTADAINWNLEQSDKNYLHVKLMDEVGNATYKSYKFGYDDFIGTTEEGKKAGSICFEKTAYRTTSAKAIITYNEHDVSGITKMMVTGNITNPSTDWEDVASERSVTLTSGDGQKTISIKFKDEAGNESPVYESLNKAELDTSAPSAGITLYKANGTEGKPQYSAEAETVIKITVSDDTLGLVEDSNVEYRVWGDFEGSDDAKWEPLTMDTGKASKNINVTVTGAKTTTVATPKNFNVQIRDKVGNMSEIATASFYFDPTEPTATIQSLDHNRISTVHAPRFCNEDKHGTVSSYADEVTFSIKPDEVIKEWKVCAYISEAAALAVENPAEAIAIGNTYGSENMAGETNSSNTIACLIKGADYEEAIIAANPGLKRGKDLTEEEKAAKVECADGIRYVVVYVKNEAGLWSSKYIKA